MAGLGANFEYDLKKIITLPTLRQLFQSVARVKLTGVAPLGAVSHTFIY